MQRTKKTGTPGDIPMNDVRLVAEYLRTIMTLRHSSTCSQFQPDKNQLKELLIEMDEKTVHDLLQFIKHPNLHARYPKGLDMLLSFENILKYDCYSRSVVQSVQNVIFKNESNLSPTEVVQYLVSYILCIHGGPLLSSNAEGANPKMPDPAELVVVYNTMVILDNMLKDSSPLFAKGIDVDLLRFSIESFSPDKRAVMKMLVGLPISSKENHAYKRANYRVPKTLLELAKFKEESLFPRYGCWAVTTILIFPGLKLGADINYNSLLNGINRLIKTKFITLRIRQKAVPTLFGGIRNLTEMRICREQWEFTDPAEAEMLQQYLNKNINALMGKASK